MAEPADGGAGAAAALRRPVSPAFLAGRAAIERAEKRRRVAANLAALEQDLWLDRLVFQSRPRTADVQFSNYCNMACTMCYPDGNPPLQVMPAPLLEKLVADLFPTLAVLEPFAGSEPLVFTWDLTRRIAELFSIELDIVTNAQFLDEKRFHELEPHVASLRLSIDSHDPEIYAAIRRKSRPEAVFANLRRAAALCRDHSIEAIVNVVFMAENARRLDETVAWFADLGIPTVNLLQYHYTDARGAASDPNQVLPPGEVDAILARVRATAERKQVAVFFDLDRKESIDFRPAGRSFRPNSRNDEWYLRFRRFFPGYCLQSIDRVKVNADGSVYPCCVGGGEQLKLGNLNEQSFEAVWNGAESQDLRRGMLTQDLPPLCQGCSFVRGFLLSEQARMVFHDAFATTEQLTEAEPAAPTAAAATAAPQLLAPDHLVRSAAAPTFRWTRAAFPATRQVLVLAAGGEVHPINARFELAGDATEFTVPDAAWNALRGNLGYWWSVFAVDDASRRFVRSPTARCIVRHHEIPRIAGSTLYAAETSLYRFAGVADAGAQ